MRQVLTPSALGFVTYTFLLLMQGLLQLAEQIFVRGLPVRDAMAILLATLPHGIVLTIPMGFLFGVLIAVGRLNADNEIIAMQAGGISAMRLLRPILILGVLLTILNGYLYTEVIPRKNRELRDLRMRLFTSAKNIGRIEPNVFYDEFPNLLLYVENVDVDTGTWENVLAYDNSSPGEERLILARKGRVVTADETYRSDVAGDSGEKSDRNEMPWILLENVVTHQFYRSKPDTYRANKNQTQLFRPRMESQGVIRYNLGMGERDTSDLVTFVRGGDLSAAHPMSEEDLTRQRLLAGVELHRRLAFPAASAVFALLALPLGVGSRAGGRGRGFVLSIAVVLVYYVMNNNGELLVLEGKIPVWLGIWFPNIMLTTISLFMMRRMGRWLAERHRGGGIVVRLIRRWRRWRAAVQAKTSDGTSDGTPVTGSIPVSLQRRRYGGGFPTRLDRYLTRRLMGPLLMVLISTALLYIVVDLSDRIDDIGQNDVPLEVVVGYYWNLVPQMVIDVIPFALLIGVLVLLTVLERQQELTALKGAGISLYRLIVPVMLVACAGTAVMWVLGESVLPEATRKRERLLDRIRGKHTARSYSNAHRQWMLSRDDSTFYNFLRYEASEQTMIRFNMYRVDESMRLRFNLFAHRVRYVNGAWMADSGWFRRIDSDGVDTFQRIESPLELGISEGPNYFGQEYRRPTEMTHRELGEYIRELVDSGYKPYQLTVRWHQKFSYPLSAIIMVCLALPYGLNRGGRRVTTMQGVALALALGIGYFLMVAVFGKLGEAGALPPVIGAWSPILLALLFAANRMTTLRT